MVGLPLVPSDRFQFRPKFRMVVDLTIENYPEAAILVAHGLIGSFREIDDCKPTMAQAYSTLGRNPGACTVWPAMSHSVPHFSDIGLGDPEPTASER
jgi:hypothetical protein